MRSIIQVGKWSFVVDYAIQKMGDFAAERMVTNIPAVRKDAGNLQKIVLSGKQLRCKKLAVAQAATGPTT